MHRYFFMLGFFIFSHGFFSFNTHSYRFFVLKKIAMELENSLFTGKKPCIQETSFYWLLFEVIFLLSNSRTKKVLVLTFLASHYIEESDDTDAVKGDIFSYFSSVTLCSCVIFRRKSTSLPLAPHHRLADNVSFPLSFSLLIGQHAPYTLDYIATSFFGAHLTSHESLLMWLDVDKIILKLEAKKCVFFPTY